MNTEADYLLDAWLKLSSTVQNVHLKGPLTHNESLVCFALFRQHQKDPDASLTPTELAHITKIRPSQINRNLNKLEAKGIVTRTRSTEDRRRVNVRMNPKQATLFEIEYGEMLTLAHAFVRHFGMDESLEATRLMNKATETILQSLPMDEE